MKSSGGESDFAYMKLFNRKSSTPTTSSDGVQDYYQTGQTEHKAMAWLLALATFIVTLLLILVLFFAGRWVYQKITNNDSGSSEQTTQPQGDTTSTPDIDGNGNSQSSGGDNGGQTNGAQTDGGVTDDEPQTSSTSTSTPSQATTQPNTGPEELVRTGPDQDL